MHKFPKHFFFFELNEIGILTHKKLTTASISNDMINILPNTVHNYYKWSVSRHIHGMTLTHLIYLFCLPYL